MTETIINYKHPLNKEMYWPFKQQKQQKMFGIIVSFMGIALMMLNPTLPYISNITASGYIGVIIFLIGLAYLMEAVF